MIYVVYYVVVIECVVNSVAPILMYDDVTINNYVVTYMIVVADDANDVGVFVVVIVVVDVNVIVAMCITIVAVVTESVYVRSQCRCVCGQLS